LRADGEDRAIKLLAQRTRCQIFARNRHLERHGGKMLEETSLDYSFLLSLIGN